MPIPAVVHSGKFNWVLRDSALSPIASSVILDYSMDLAVPGGGSGVALPSSILDSITSASISNLYNGAVYLDINILTQHEGPTSTGNTVLEDDSTYIYTVELDEGGLSNNMTLFIGKPCGQVLHCSGDISQFPSGTWINTSGLNPELSSHIDETIQGYNHHPSGNLCMFDYNRIYQSGNISLPEFLFTNDGNNIKQWNISTSGLTKTHNVGPTNRMICAEPVYKHIYFASGTQSAFTNYSGTYIQGFNIGLNESNIFADSQRTAIISVNANYTRHSLFGYDPVINSPNSNTIATLSGAPSSPLACQYNPKLNRLYYTILNSGGTQVDLYAFDNSRLTDTLVYSNTDINRFAYCDINDTLYYGKNSGNNIFKRPIGGAESTLIVNSEVYNKPVDLVVDASRNRLYWSNVSGYVYYSDLSGVEIVKFCQHSGTIAPYIALDCQNGGITFQSKAKFQLEDVASGIGYTDAQQFSLAWVTVANEISDHPGNISGNIPISGVFDVFKAQILMPYSGYVWESKFVTDRDEKYFRNVPYNKEFYYQSTDSSGVSHIGGDVYTANVPQRPYYSKIYPENNSWTSWNSGILELEVTSFNLPYNSGNSKIHTVEVVGNHCMWPNFGQLITNAITLYIQGPVPETSGIDLFIDGIYRDNSGIDLYLEGPGYREATMPLYIHNPVFSGTNTLQLFLLGPQSGENSGNFPLYIQGGEISSGDMFPLFIGGTGIFVPTSGLIDLYLMADTPIGALPLFIEGFGSSGNDSIPLHTFSIGNTSSGLYSDMSLFLNGDFHASMPLFIGSPASGTYSETLPLYIGAAYSGTENSLELFIKNTNTEIVSGIDLFLKVKDDGLYGSLIANDNMPLYIARDSEGTSYWFPLTILGPSGSTNSFDMYVAGATTTNSGMDLYMSGIGNITNNFTLYEHGY